MWLGRSARRPRNALSWVSTFVLVALLVGGAVFAFQLDRRTELIATINRVLEGTQLADEY